MNPFFEKKAGLALIIFTLLILFTLIFHPTGGNFQHLLKIAPMILLTHSVAILSLPFAAIGFWGLTRRIGADNFLAVSAFAMAALALTAVLIAGSTNGLILPLFAYQYKDASPDIVDTLKPVMAYSHAVNTAFDYVYVGTFCMAILFWSVAIFSTRRLPRWIAVWGMLVAISGIAVTASGTSPASMYGFHLFGAGLISWVIIVGSTLTRTSPA